MMKAKDPAGFLNDPRVRQLLAPEVLTFMEANQPPPNANSDFQAGHWAAVAATAMTEILTLKQRIREMEALFNSTRPHSGPETMDTK